MKSSAIMAAVAILSCLLVLCAQGRPVPESSRCQCSNGFTKIQGSMLRKPHQFHVQHPTNFCPNTEIILTLAGGKKKCVDPKSRLGGLALKQDSLKKQAAASSTAASSQTPTGSPATVQTTSSL
ncbi:interleukin-8-like [Salarias fasciatus]|uniref:interleukin-8-like n=1 Tax=Salarias fasciatus TaxID=181472 RepID=UPI00117671DB|nr:interleukin-8-like [Salarias fasciatus]